MSIRSPTIPVHVNRANYQYVQCKIAGEKKNPILPSDKYMLFLGEIERSVAKYKNTIIDFSIQVACIKNKQEITIRKPFLRKGINIDSYALSSIQVFYLRDFGREDNSRKYYYCVQGLHRDRSSYKLQDIFLTLRKSYTAAPMYLDTKRVVFVTAKLYFFDGSVQMSNFGV